jgi:hypothetical protein
LDTECDVTFQWIIVITTGSEHYATGNQCQACVEQMINFHTL